MDATEVNIPRIVPAEVPPIAELTLEQRLDCLENVIAYDRQRAGESAERAGYIVGGLIIGFLLAWELLR